MSTDIYRRSNLYILKDSLINRLETEIDVIKKQLILMAINYFISKK